MSPGKEITPPSNAVFLESDSGVYSYIELQKYTHQIYDLLIESGYNGESPVALLSATTDEIVLAIASLWNLQIPFIPLSPKLTKREITSYLGRLNPSVILVDQENFKRNIGSKSSKTLIPDFDNTYVRKSGLRTQEADLESVFGYFFTSGTTGKPKIVPLKRRQLEVAAKSSGTNFRPDQNGLWLLCMPLNHIGGISVILRSLFYGSGIYREDGFDVAKVKQLLRENKRIQVASFVPTMLKRLLDDPEFSVHERFITILLGGAATSVPLLRESISRNIPAISSFGMTETCAQIISVPLTERTTIKSGLVGKIFSGNEISIRDNNGKPLKSNEKGSIWLKGPQIFDGYFDPENNVGRFDDAGWFNTGDYGWIDKDDNIFIYSRQTDLIVTGGENVSPVEVEEAIMNLDGIAEVAITGVPDQEWGYLVTALIVPKKGYNFDLRMLRSDLKKDLAPYKLPRKLVLVDQLPRTLSGKLIRNKLPELAIAKS